MVTRQVKTVTKTAPAARIGGDGATRRGLTLDEAVACCWRPTGGGGSFAPGRICGGNDQPIADVGNLAPRLE